MKSNVNPTRAENNYNVLTLDTHTKHLLKEMESKKIPYQRQYRGFEVTVFPQVFAPPLSLSRQTGISAKHRRDYEGKMVLDMGCGTGIQAIIAALSGAQKVVAVDNFEPAIENAQLNVEKYTLSEKIELIPSDLFDKVNDTFDTIIAYLPTIPYCVQKPWELAVLDPEFQIHARFFENAHKHLKPQGKIRMAHSTSGNVAGFEELVKNNGFTFKRTSSYPLFDSTWIFYDIDNCTNKVIDNRVQLSDRQFRKEPHNQRNGLYLEGKR